MTKQVIVCIIGFLVGGFAALLVRSVLHPPFAGHAGHPVTIPIGAPGGATPTESTPSTPLTGGMEGMEGMNHERP